MDEEHPPPVPTETAPPHKPRSWIVDFRIFDWAGLSVLVLSLGVAATLVIGTLIPAFQGREVSTALGNVLSGGVGASIGAIATYIGMKAQKSRQE